MNEDDNLNSPYCDKSLYDRQQSKAWFAIDTLKYDEKVENIAQLFEGGSFLEGNFVRITSVRDKSEASIISQVIYFLFIAKIHFVLIMIAGTVNVLLAW